jgi:hypothetical protein
VQPQKPALGLATPDLMMSRVEFERHGGVGIDNDHDLLVGNDCVDNTSTRRGTRQCAGAGAGHGATRRSGHGATRHGMGAPPRGGLGRADNTVSRNERSEELEISVGRRSVDGVDRGESVDGPFRPSLCWSVQFFFKIPDLCFVAFSQLFS